MHEIVRVLYALRVNAKVGSGADEHREECVGGGSELTGGFGAGLRRQWTPQGNVIPKPKGTDVRLTALGIPPKESPFDDAVLPVLATLPAPTTGVVRVEVVGSV